MRQLYPDFVAHEVTFVVLGNAFFRSFTAVEFLSFLSARYCDEQLKVHTTKPYPILRSMSTLGYDSSGSYRWKNVLEFYIDNVAYLAKAALQIFFTSVLWEPSDIDLVRLQERSMNTQIPVKEIRRQDRGEQC